MKLRPLKEGDKVVVQFKENSYWAKIYGRCWIRGTYLYQGAVLPLVYIPVWGRIAVSGIIIRRVK